MSYDESQPPADAQFGEASSEIVPQGQRAWADIKATAADQRKLWRAVGAALNHGRAQHRSNQAFGAWCATHGFDMKPDLRADAMWLASNWPVIGASEDASHPTWIRKAHRAVTKRQVKPRRPKQDAAATERERALDDRERDIGEREAECDRRGATLEDRERELKERERTVNVHAKVTGKATTFTLEEYRLIRSCLHPDHINGVEEARLRKAFQAFSRLA
ncbi:MAG: hypothetical protein EON92_18245 [Burkholderiales bacterium]|nr:MAG: hypothetical protein EON92_18245 [Burkholderiales bacterium]